MRKTEPLSQLSLRTFDDTPLPEEMMWSSVTTAIERYGYVVIRNVPESFDPVKFSAALGDFVPQYTGVLIGDVMPEPGMDAYYHAGNTRPLFPHSEGYDFAGLPPRYLCLWCVTPAVGAGGETTLADGRVWLDTLPAATRTLLQELQLSWKTTDAAESLGLSVQPVHPMIEHQGPDERQILRFSTNNVIIPEDHPELREVLKSAVEFYEANCISVTYEPRDVLLFDNWRMLHARNAFEDRARHLRRIQIGAR